MNKLFLSLALFATLLAKAQNLGTTTHQASISLGIDPALSYQLRYEHTIPNILKDKTLYLFSELTLPVSRSNIKNADLKLGARAAIVSWGNYKVVTSINSSYGQTENISFNAHKIAVEGQIAIGYFAPQKYLSLNISDEEVVLIHLEHSDYYRERFYQGAQDGWFSGAGGRIEIGIDGGYRLYDGIHLSAALKVPLTTNFMAFRGSPAHLLLGCHFQF